ncbi:MAG: Type 1 glutamine amidotransferase-like domain-containing protein [Candidatus Azambacteria bacterium]|nr:Type 1 glutamine amidotransferase-like domain-containing protein [Candidatus Azambacteria bacterium]
MTKCILHGGYAGRVNPENDLFFREILKDTSDEVNVLLVHFARNEDEYERFFEENTTQFKRNKENKNLSFEVASEDDFINQVDKSDVIYLQGGPTLKLLKVLKKYPNLEENLKSKTVAGESAGAYVLSSCFYSKSEGGVFDGLGFVPVKTICHYIGENKEELDRCPHYLEKVIKSELFSAVNGLFDRGSVSGSHDRHYPSWHSYARVDRCGV